MEYKTGKYYKLVMMKELGHQEVIAYFYRNPDFYMNPESSIIEGKDYSEVGFGFNTADGAGFLPLHDLSGVSKVIPLEIVEVDTEKKKELFDLVEKADQIVAYSFSCVNRDDTTFTQFSNEWKPAMLIGEMAFAKEMVVQYEFNKHRRIQKG